MEVTREVLNQKPCQTLEEVINFINKLNNSFISLEATPTIVRHKNEEPKQGGQDTLYVIHLSDNTLELILCCCKTPNEISQTEQDRRDLLFIYETIAQDTFDLIVTIYKYYTSKSTINSVIENINTVWSDDIFKEILLGLRDETKNLIIQKGSDYFTVSDIFARLTHISICYQPKVLQHLVCTIFPDLLASQFIRKHEIKLSGTTRVMRYRYNPDHWK